MNRCRGSKAQAQKAPSSKKTASTSRGTGTTRETHGAPETPFPGQNTYFGKTTIAAGLALVRFSDTRRSSADCSVATATAAARALVSIRRTLSARRSWGSCPQNGVQVGRYIFLPLLSLECQQTCRSQTSGLLREPSFDMTVSNIHLRYNCAHRVRKFENSKS